MENRTFEEARGDRPDAVALRKQFEESGYVVLRGFLPREVVDNAISSMKQLVDETAAKLAADGLIADTLAEEPFETRLYTLYRDRLERAPKSFRKELHLPGLFGLFFHPPLLDVVESLLGDEIRLYPNYTARPKLPGWEGTQVLWHQDAGYTESIKVDASASVDALRMVNVWAPLVPATKENGCMQFIPGTHKLGTVPHEKREHYLQIADAYLSPRLAEATDIELDPGDVVLFNNLLFHQGQPNATERIRWSIDWRYQDAGQPTYRADRGHLARSRTHPDDVIGNAAEWVRVGWQ
ncbi:phytanoyl-CoA dioxygenase family protein [Paenibacillus cymbidii]|uniref:phytanoyl-CoA dioxygenase family protein n=1 Tax=Paenibacillus cymbidii TaxID=1639034 RepID=UPI00108157FB|nr:phytanoyl-CoA dioxygenase family protein [Paenibacillus cymbidii]